MSPNTFPIDALSLSITRAAAVLALLAVQFDDPETGGHSDAVNSSAIGTVGAELATIRALIAEHMGGAL